MIGPLSSSLALAQRTATKARATMDTMSRQIATGQKVASVKDNGAAWAQAAGLKSQLQVHDSNTQRLSLYSSATDISDAWGETELIFTEKMRDLYLAASQHPAGSSQRTLLKAELDQLISGLGSSFGVADVAPIAPHSANDASHGLLAGLTVIGRNFGGLHANVITPVITAAPLDTASAAAIAAQVSDLNTHLTNLRGLDLGNSALQKRIAVAVSSNAALEGATIAAIGSLTDADLGQVSAARAQADTRQQLALQTISQAISAYSNYAGGLLGNVQRTQRSVLA
jgi:flagellin-like hook-associated protein FlgL